MGTATGIEIGPDSCVLVAVRPRRGGPAEVRAFHTIERSEWPPTGAALAAALLAVRRSRRLPRRARVVSWDVPGGASPGDAGGVAALRPLKAAGFRVDAILSPPEALARLAASRPREGAAAWLALNIHGAAIAIVRGESLLFSRTFPWSYTTDLAGTRAQLLQRYSLVAQLAPEIRRGLAAVRLEHNETVSTVITCGDLPELRSLTMPLIEELDLEVETLDSTDGLEAVGRARMERFAESAPALRLACAAALAPPARGRAWNGRRAAAAAAIVAALGAGVLVWRARAPEPPRTTSAQPHLPPPRTPTPAPMSTPAAAPTPMAATPPAGTPVAAPAPATRRAEPAPAPPATATRNPERAPAPPAPRSPTGAPLSAAVPEPPVPATKAAAGSASGLPARSTSSLPAPSPVPTPAHEAPRSLPAAPTQSPPVPTLAGTPAPGRSTAKAAAPLKDPLPKVDSILIDQDRRLAIVDGVVVAVGDSLGARVVVAITRDGLVLREPSGLAVKVPLRPSAGRPPDGGA